MDGVVVSETTSETAIATTRVTENSRNRRPTIPPIRRMGMKTAINEALMETTVKEISREPFSAAAAGPNPFSRYRVMFSMTTMASSTTNPVEIANAMSERLSTLYPSRYITPNVPSRDRGTEMLGIIVAQRFRRNRNTTRITNPIEIRMVYSMSEIDARIVAVRSIMTARFTDGGIDAFNC